MRQFYTAILRLYPAQYRQAFEQEMIETFAQAAMDSRRGGPFRFVVFTACELAGLLNGFLFEWTAKWANQEAYITSRSSVPQRTDLPGEVAEAQTRLEHLLRSMEFAIAHHDFPKARFYSNEERIAREQLRRLVRKYRLESALDLSGGVPEFQ